LVALQGHHVRASFRMAGPFKNNLPTLLLNDTLKFFIGASAHGFFVFFNLSQPQMIDRYK
jgi:hypothetical protein